MACPFPQSLPWLPITTHIALLYSPPFLTSLQHEDWSGFDRLTTSDFPPFRNCFPILSRHNISWFPYPPLCPCRIRPLLTLLNSLFPTRHGTGKSRVMRWNLPLFLTLSVVYTDFRLRLSFRGFLGTGVSSLLPSSPSPPLYLLLRD